MVADVPLVVPTVNAAHLDTIPQQRTLRKRNKGFLVTNANCSTTGLVVPLKALHDAFGIESIFAVTLQAVSGAGYPGVPSLDIMENVIPFIDGEEDKIEVETKKILGSAAQDGTFNFLETVKVTAHCNRVPVRDGHLECVSVKLSRSPAADKLVEEVTKVLESYRPPGVTGRTFSMPEKAIVVMQEPDRPQSRVDRMQQGGYAAIVGRIRPCPLTTIKFVVLSHNTILGAAGSAIMNAEIAVQKGLLPQP
jgi:aspartate-semialdehyde dehydrogenase